MHKPWVTGRYRALGGVLLIALLTGCGERIETFDGPTMGSTYSIKYVRDLSGPSPRQVKVKVEALLQQVDEQMSTYRKDSLVSRFNQLPAQSCMTLPDSMLGLVSYGSQLSEDSQGAYDLTVEPLMNLWGFGPDAHRERVPLPAEIAQVLTQIGHRHLRINHQQLCKDTDIKLDFDSIAAGYTVDEVSTLLEQMGVHSYLVEITGELKAVGRKPDGSPWRIAIEAPRNDQQVAQISLDIDGYGMSTSGDYRNYFEANGNHYSHIFDPVSGAPIDHNLTSVTVVDPSARNADGLSTLLIVLGPERGYQYAVTHKIAALFITRETKGFVSRNTPAFESVLAGKKAD
ncbi:MAG TPA: FAD:protein FMN transferase [Pseudomonas sp.]|jgi:thiamine biosynthesis lipoprotein|uniref:FAD:protein FMN transferase n=1 Tax=Pseudomonas sp. TaxID=306 RepID=UPI002EDB2296